MYSFTSMFCLVSKITFSKTYFLKSCDIRWLNMFCVTASQSIFALAIASLTSCIKMSLDNILPPLHSVCLPFWPWSFCAITMWDIYMNSFSLFFYACANQNMCRAALGQWGTEQKHCTKAADLPLQLWNSQSASNRNQSQVLHIETLLMESSHFCVRLISMDYIHAAGDSNFLLLELKSPLDIRLPFLFTVSLDTTQLKCL